MTTVRKEGYGSTDVCIDVEGNSINNKASIIAADPKPKNWPSCMPFIRHNLKEDIPPEFRTIMKLMLFHCFYVLFFLLLSLVTTLIEMFSGTIKDVILSILSTAGAPVWIIVWGTLAFSLYALLYKSVAHNKTGCFVAFVIGTIFEILLSIYVSVGFPPYAPLSIWSVFFGRATAVIVIAFIVNIAFAINTVFLIVAFVVILVRFPKLGNMYQVINVYGDSVAPKIGTTEALPAEVGGRKIKYFDEANTSANARSLSTLPEDTITVISEWKKVSSSTNGSYLLYVENEPERVYWSSYHIDGILDNGAVNPITQVLTISRLPGGSFVFGTMDKE